jgi:hypothetical protein
MSLFATEAFSAYADVKNFKLTEKNILEISLNRAGGAIESHTYTSTFDNNCKTKKNNNCVITLIDDMQMLDDNEISKDEIHIINIKNKISNIEIKTITIKFHDQNTGVTKMYPFK